jgi:hypothetical protein
LLFMAPRPGVRWLFGGLAPDQQPSCLKAPISAFINISHDD